MFRKLHREGGRRYKSLHKAQGNRRTDKPKLRWLHEVEENLGSEEEEEEGGWIEANRGNSRQGPNMTSSVITNIIKYVAY